jgi:hypothetical protein
MARRSRSSDRWLPEHFTGPPVKQAKTLLKPDGDALMKPLQGAGFRSPETYLLASGGRMV